MNKILKICIFILVISPINSTFSQYDELGMLNTMMGGMTGATEEKVEDYDEKLVDKTDVTEKKIISLKDNKFSYTGGDNFVTSPQSKFLSSELNYFGYDFFSNIPSTFFRASDIPIPSDYMVGPGDILKVFLYGNVNKILNLKINNDGEIFFPEIGPINLVGSSFIEIKEILKNIVDRQLIGTQVQINLSSLRSINVFVLGDAVKPGMYTISALSSLTNAIFASGGVNPNGSLRNIQLKRNGKIITLLDFYDVLLNGDITNDIKLRSGDVIFIPSRSKTVAINGEVARPGIYELKEKEVLADLIKYSGNLKPKANLNSAEIQRVKPSLNGFELIDIDLNQKYMDSFILNNGDLLNVYSVADNLSNAVLLHGHVKEPGFYPLKSGMTIGSLIKSKSELLAMADMNYLIVKRESKTNQDYQFFQVDLEDVFENQTSETNILLEERDEIIVFPTLLTANEITTKLIKDKIIFNYDRQMDEKENEWQSLTYLRKSIFSEAESPKMSLDADTKGSGDSSEISDDSKGFYEYTVYNYCTVPIELVINIVKSSGYYEEKSILLKELEGITNPLDIQKLITQIEKETIKVKNNFKQQDPTLLSDDLTELCRRQLLHPLMEIIDRQILKNGEKRSVSVYGNVYFPGDYPLTENMNIGDTVRAAGGLKDATYSSEVELIRSNNSGKKFYVDNTFLSLNETGSEEVNVKEMDTINIKEISQNLRTVTITGEVYFAGTYPISDNQTLKEVIARAGGLSEYASAEAAVFQRESLKEAELNRSVEAKSELRKKILLSSQSGGLGQDSLDQESIATLTELVVGNTEEVQSFGRLIIDLESILNGEKQDIILQDGDSLHIPKTQQSVSVIGEVYLANAHLYNESLSYSDYINLSGGVNSYGDEDNLYLIKADGSIISPDQFTKGGFFRNSNNKLQPGDTIVVPLNVTPFSSIKATTEITQIIYQMALAAAAVNSF
mgnify:CR=1 FL=1|tara:strand:- start:342 stop:3218 length:2877 start_codon:yes stop_codon:yes gene_type:complete